MPYLVDTNILLRAMEMGSPHNSAATTALLTLTTIEDQVYIAGQNLYELWNVMTRPADTRSGLGFSLSRAVREIEIIEATFTVVDDGK